jgi:hypothetical protein
MHGEIPHNINAEQFAAGVEAQRTDLIPTTLDSDTQQVLDRTMEAARKLGLKSNGVPKRRPIDLSCGRYYEPSFNSPLPQLPETTPDGQDQI